MQSRPSELTQIKCIDHKDFPCTLISLTKDQCQRRLLCARCLYQEDQKEWKQDYKEVMPLSIVLRSPDKMIDKVFNDYRSKYLETFYLRQIDLEELFNKQIEKFSLLEQIHGQIKEKLKQQLKEYQNFQEQLKKQGQIFLEKIQFTTVKQMIFELQDLEKQQKQEQYIAQFMKLMAILDEMFKDNSFSIGEKFNELATLHINMKLNVPQFSSEQYQLQVQGLFKQHEEFIQKLNNELNPQISFEKPNFKILSDDFCSTLLLKFQSLGKQIKSMGLIFLGSRDGLNGKAFWSKVNEKRNLLMVFKSKINSKDYIFGSFSPCQWQQNLANYVQDDTFTSFLFSQTYNQIYPLKTKSNTIYCNQSYGPTNGGGHDLYITADFNSGSSNIGHSYQTDKQKQQFYLFGGQSTAVIECEIYEVIFI